MSNIWLTYSFTEQELKSLCAMLRTRGKNAGGARPFLDALSEFEKTLNSALIKRISLEEAEQLFNEN